MEMEYQQIKKRDGAVVPFTPIRITNAIYRAAIAVGGRDRSMAEGLTGKVIAHLEQNHPGEIPAVEMVQDAIEKVLIENGHARTSKAFILYRDERTRKRQGRIGDLAGPNQQGDCIPWKKIWNVLNWAIDHRVATVGQLNERIREGSFFDLVKESEEEYSLDIARAADAILKRRSEVRVVIVAGPSSSGKTTTTIKIAEHLRNEGFDFVPFHVDNYFYNLEDHPKDEFGDYDYETPQALDLVLINDHLKRLLAGETVDVPWFNFMSGKREGSHESLKINDQQILLIDSLHGLYGAMTEGIPNSAKFKLYIESLLQMRGTDGSYIRWTDLRLIRRMVRDSRTRNQTPTKTLEHWHYVRRSELEHICPFVTMVDYVVNGALAYELPIWSARMKDNFQKWAKDYQGDNQKADSYRRASRVGNMLESITPWTDELIIPEKALLREFIGGSVYKY